MWGVDDENGENIEKKNSYAAEVEPITRMEASDIRQFHALVFL